MLSSMMSNSANEANSTISNEFLLWAIMNQLECSGVYL